LKNSDNFENGILTAVNSSGNNMARATLTGALIGAMVGIGGIPHRFIHGLTDTGKAPTQQGQYLLSLAQKLSG
jgi:ADP-ribosylglycohydrolase